MNAPVIDRRSSEIANNTGGGVMTEEVGAVTGELTLRTELLVDLTAVLLVQYREAEEWYQVTGGRCALGDRRDLDAVHELAVGLLHRPQG